MISTHYLRFSHHSHKYTECDYGKICNERLLPLHLRKQSKKTVSIKYENEYFIAYRNGRIDKEIIAEKIECGKSMGHTVTSN